MTQPIACPFCHEQLENDTRLAGQLVKCPGCGREFRMPGEANPYRSPLPVGGQATSTPSMGDWPYPTPLKVTIVQIMMVVGGFVALSVAVGWTASLIGFLWPGMYFSYFIGFFAIYRGVTLLKQDTPPRGTAVLQILNLIAFDPVNAALGVVELILLSDPQVEAFFASRRK